MSQAQRTLSLLKTELGPEPAQVLIDHFYAALSNHYLSVGGSSGFDQEGYFFDEARVASTAQPYPGKITWSLRRRRDGSLLTVIASGEGATWQDSAQRFFINVQTSALAGAPREFVHRSTFMYFGPSLAGEYWFGRVRVSGHAPEAVIQLMHDGRRQRLADDLRSSVGADVINGRRGRRGGLRRAAGPEERAAERGQDSSSMA